MLSAAEGQVQARREGAGRRVSASDEFCIVTAAASPRMATPVPRITGAAGAGLGEADWPLSDSHRCKRSVVHTFGKAVDRRRRRDPIGFGQTDHIARFLTRSVARSALSGTPPATVSLRAPQTLTHGMKGLPR